jgi:hypothetical protein
MRNQVYALMIVGTDEDIIPHTLNHLIAEGIDKILIDLVPVEDSTAEIIRDIESKNPGKLEIFPSEDVSIWGSRRMTRLANIAYEQGVDLVLPCDADEFFYANNGNLLADEIRVSQGIAMTVPVYSHAASTKDDPKELNPYKRMGWRCKEALRLPKAFCRFNPLMKINEGNHGISWTNGNTIPGDLPNVSMRHYSYRSPDLFVKKVKIAEKAMLATPGYPLEWGVQYRLYADTLRRAGEQALKDWFAQWFCVDAKHPKDEFTFDPAPWRD